MKTDVEARKSQIQCYEILPKIGGGICPRCGLRTEYIEGQVWCCANCKLICDPDNIGGRRDNKYVTEGWDPK